MAQNREAELRPLLLRVHVRNFIDAPRRDAAADASFEAIALGLIPLVPDDALADAAAMLRNHPGAPPAVLDALEERLSRGRRADDAFREEERAATAEALALACDPTRTIDGDLLARLVERAITDRNLARALLTRTEPTVFDRAALYRHAGPETRVAIRRDLGAALARVSLPPLSGSGAAAREILRIAGRADPVALVDAVAARLGVRAQPFDLRHPAGQELCLFGLMALGLNEAECIRAFLMLGTPQSRSVAVIFHLSQMARTTSRPVAAFLAGHEKVAAGRRPSPEASPPPRAAGQLRADGRADPIAPTRHPDRTGRDRGPSVLLDRRS